MIAQASTFIRQMRTAMADDLPPRDAAIVRYLPFVVWAARRYWRSDLEFEDLVQDGAIAVIGCIDRGDTEMDDVAREVYAAVRKKRQSRHVSLADIPDPAERDRVSVAFAEWLINLAVDRLPPRLKSVITRRLEGKPKVEIAKDENTSPELIAWRERRGLKMIYETFGKTYKGENLAALGVAPIIVNRKNAHYITAFGETKTLSRWAREAGVSNNCLRHRIYNAGMSPEQAILKSSRRA